MLSLPNPKENKGESAMENKSIITEVLSQDERETPSGRNARTRQYNEILNTQPYTNDNFSSQV